MGKNMRWVLLLAVQYPGWHTCGKDRGTIDAIVRLGNEGLIETNAYGQFRLVGNELLFRLKQDVQDMKSSVQTQFTRCLKCGHLHDSGWECVHCEQAKPMPSPPVIRPRIAGEFGGRG